MIELINILKSIRGKDENGDPKSGLFISEYSMDSSGAMKQNKERSFATPTINILRNGDFILLDLVFPKTGAGELRAAWNFLKNFGEKQNEKLDDLEENILEFMIVPLEYSGKYFCTLINPIFWCLQPSAPGLQADSIRMLFERDTISFLEGEEIDEKEIEKEIQYEIREEQRLNEVAEKQRIERENYLDRMNEKFNHMND